MGGKIFFVIAIIVAIVVAIFFLAQGKSLNQLLGGMKINTPPTPVAQTIVTVTYTGSGFSPKNTTVEKGTRVTWVNKSGKDATVNSDDYPTNKKFPFLNLGDYPDGSSVQVVFNKTGTFTYYNYFTPTHHGTVTVK